MQFALPGQFTQLLQAEDPGELIQFLQLLDPRESVHPWQLDDPSDLIQSCPWTTPLDNNLFKISSPVIEIKRKIITHTYDAINITPSITMKFMIDFSNKKLFIENFNQAAINHSIPNYLQTALIYSKSVFVFVQSIYSPYSKNNVCLSSREPLQITFVPENIRIPISHMNNTRHGTSISEFIIYHYIYYVSLSVIF